MSWSPYFSTPIAELLSGLDCAVTIVTGPYRADADCERGSGVEKSDEGLEDSTAIRHTLFVIATELSPRTPVLNASPCAATSEPAPQPEGREIGNVAMRTIASGLTGGKPFLASLRIRGPGWYHSGT